jgi:macrocin-O-methyltransferase TylF-like protien
VTENLGVGVQDGDGHGVGRDPERPCSSDEEDVGLQTLKGLFAESAALRAPDWNLRLPLFLRRQTLARLLLQDQLYQQILDVPGVIIELGCQFGPTLATLISLRGIHEPYNHSRQIIGFDSFEGFPSVSTVDGTEWVPGQYSTGGLAYRDELERLLTAQESFSPLSHLKKFELVAGDITQTLPRWLDDNPNKIVAMALFDLDLYEPTKTSLESIRDRCTRGTVVVFDELSHRRFPGEAVALREVLGLTTIRLRRSPLQPSVGWFVYGE